MENKDLIEILESYQDSISVSELKVEGLEEIPKEIKQEAKAEALTAINQHIYKEVMELLGGYWYTNADGLAPVQDVLAELREAARRRFLDE